MLRKLTALAIALAGCSAYEPTPVTNAVVHLAFERSLDNLGGAELVSEAHDGKVSFARSQTGQAYFSQGDGRWLEYEAAAPIALSDAAEISLDLNRADWTNPYDKGRAARTAAVVSGRSEKRIHHIAFNFSSGPDPALYVYFDDADGETHRLSSAQGMSPDQWRAIRLRMNADRGVTELLIDDRPVASTNATPIVLETGVSQIKLGTWHKKNQAFRGRIDNFVISSSSAS